MFEMKDEYRLGIPSIDEEHENFLKLVKEHINY